ncbi:MAG TPA: polysaccharide deacetylase family protein [Cyclobacteriaceae bacterium]|nr:polysaccharide deacetylase family protein [Cyclobacteriaceae bacterium]
MLIAFSCQKREVKRAGICISLDDRSIKEWYEMKELLRKYNSRVTFFVTQFDSLDSIEIKMLKDLEKEGHEIGSHGALHVVSEYYIKEKSYNEYIENEIDASISAMKKNGFTPKSFAYPYGAKFWFTDLILLSKFEVLRGVEPINNERDLTLIDNIYYTFNGDRTLSAIGIDQGSGVAKEMISKAIRRATVNKEVLLLYGHSPITDISDGPYNFDIDLFEYILKEASRNDLEFIKYEDLIAK